MERDEEVLELQEFVKNTGLLRLVRKGKIGKERSRSVCRLINYSTGIQGTGFLLFDRFVLTNAHLILDFINISSNVQIISDRRDISIEVNFSFEEGNITGPDWNVKKVVLGAYGYDKKMGYPDYALLELSEDIVEYLPPPLVNHYSPPPPRGEVYIIGHPDGGAKKFDICPIIECEQRQAAIDQLQQMNWGSNVVAKDSPVVTYKTCFYHGASGSPVFDVNGEVFAMHSGGYLYEINSRTMSVIEYAIPLQLILKHLLLIFKSRPDIFQIINKGLSDPLWHLIAKLND